MPNNLVALFWAVLPVVLYSILVYRLVPEDFLSLRRAKRYLITGMLAPLLVFAFNYAFPSFGVPLNSDSTLKVFGYQTFIQIGLVEEMTKFLTFWWVFTQRRSAINDLPIATMFYCMMASAGFALVENISYLMNYGDQILLIRAISAIVLHMITGMMMGYCIQLGFSKIMMSEKYSFKEIMKMKFHKWKFIITGIILATIYHGIYDLNFFLPFNSYSQFFFVVIIFLGLLITWFMIKEGIRLSRELRANNHNKDLDYF